MKPAMSATSAISSTILRYLPVRTILRLRRARDPNEIVRTLSPITAAGDKHRVVQAMEDLCTPLEFAEALARSKMFVGKTRQTLLGLSIARLLEETPPEPYQRRLVAPHVNFMHDPSVPKREKCLLIVLGGLSSRPFTPRVAFAQYLPSSRFDLAFLRDEARASFQYGIPNYAGSIFELARRLDSDLDASGYRRVALLGCSISGLTALRLGILLGAERAISISGQYNWHIGRMLKGSAIPAFDLLCESGPRGKTRLICAYGAENLGDIRQIDRLSRSHSVERYPVQGTQLHNIIQYLILEGRIRPFLADVLDG